MDTYPFGFPTRHPQVGEQIVIALTQHCFNQFLMGIFRRLDGDETLAFERTTTPESLGDEIATLVVSLNECLLTHNMTLRIGDVRMINGAIGLFVEGEIRKWINTHNPTFFAPNGFVQALMQTETITMTITRPTI